jgi:hypothetical protein
VASVRGPRELSLLGNGHEQLELSQLHHSTSLTQDVAAFIVDQVVANVAPPRSVVTSPAGWGLANR